MIVVENVFLPVPFHFSHLTNFWVFSLTTFVKTRQDSVSLESVEKILRIRRSQYKIKMKYLAKVFMTYSMFVYAGAMCGTIADIVLLNPE